MAKKKNSPVNKTKSTTDEPYVDPRLFGYREGQKIEVDGSLFMALIGFAHQVSLQERKVVYNIGDSLKTTIDSGKETITEIGVQAMGWVQEGLSIHTDNVEKGVAVHQDVINKEEAEAKFSIVKDEEKK